MNKLCDSLLTPRVLHTRAILHGQQYEKPAIKQLENETGFKVNSAGLFILPNKPFIAATPDGVIDGERNSEIKPGKAFPFLYHDSNGDVKLK